MTLFEFAVTYAVCWWMVLFMVLPHQADAPVRPGPGHAPSAPADPQLRRKIRWATLWAILPAVALYFIVGAAKAEPETIYHAGGGCTQVAAPTSADVAARDGYGAGDRKVAPATLDDPNANILGDQDHFRIPLEIPSAGYLDKAAKTQAASSTSNAPSAGTTPPASASTQGGTAAAKQNGRNVDLSESWIGMGTLEVGRDGSTTLNGKNIGQSTTLPPGCDPGTP